MRIPSVTFRKILSHSTARSHRGAARGIMLIECLVYIALLFVILEVAFKLFYSCWDNARDVRRYTDDIVSTLKIGERWRQDVRTANAPLRAEETEAGRVLRMPHATGEIDYRISGDGIWRRAGGESEWIPVVQKIKSSRMEVDQRQHVSAWRWEVELAVRRKDARVLPRFTFEAVPQNNQ